MADLYYLALRDIASKSTAVTTAELYRLPGVSSATPWLTAELSGAHWVPWGEVPKLFRNKRVCFVVHGFNVNTDHGVKGSGPVAQEFEALGRFAIEMTGADIVVPVLWPGDGFIVTSWFTAIDHVNSAGKRFAEFLTSSAFPASEVSFLTHSLGARLALETMRHTLGIRADYPFDTAITMAAAVADNTLDNPRYAKALTALRRIVVLSSTQDTVLSGVFVAGDIVENALWWNYGGNGRALGRFGPAFKANSPYAAKTEWYAIRPGRDQRHGDYLPSGWDPKAPMPNGWSRNRLDVETFVQDLVDLAEPIKAPENWATDNTSRFRKDWTPKLPPG